MKPDIEAIKNLPDDAMLTPIEAGRLLGLTPEGVRAQIKRGSMKAVQVAGRWFVLGSYMKSTVKEN
jgi:hypothetical protein